MYIFEKSKMILDQVHIPADIRDMPLSDLKSLCSEIRSEIIRLTHKNGGHLGSNLGVIELTVAIHYVFNTPIDKLLFDVGHQAYTHKLITGRRMLMEKLREADGASGFTDPLESEYDSFISGHASTALSAALGIAKARDLEHHRFKVITLMGDGSMSGGLAYEAINNLNSINDFIIILNDNQMSISKTVGGMRKYLTKLLSSRKMLYARKLFRRILNKLPNKLSKPIENFIKHLMYTLNGGTIFEDLGIQYIGPIDGHNLHDLIKTLENVRDYGDHKPILIHAITEKGMGYKPAENDIYKLHGVTNSKSEQSFTSFFEEKIVEIAEKNEKVVCITAAMESGCGLSTFAQKFPERFFDVGIAEEHAVTFAAGLAISGFSPFVCIYSTFLQRAFDQIYHDVILQNLPVRFVIDKAGLPGKDGKTHSGIYDIAILSMFENCKIYAPSNITDFEHALNIAVENHKSPTAIRFPKIEIPTEKIIYKKNAKTLVLTVGALQNIVQDVEDIDVLNILQVQPFDGHMLLSVSDHYKKIIVLEEGIYGGFSSQLLQFLQKHHRFDIMSKIKIINIPKAPVSHSSRDQQIMEVKMSPMDIKSLLLEE